MTATRKPHHYVGASCHDGSPDFCYLCGESQADCELHRYKAMWEGLKAWHLDCTDEQGDSHDRALNKMTYLEAQR